MKDPTGLAWIAFLGCAVPLGWIAAQNLLQAWLLHRRLVPCADAHRRLDRPVALSGRVHLIEPLRRRRLGGELLYYSEAVKRQAHEMSETVHHQQDLASFGIDDGSGQVVMVTGLPTEVHGLRTSVTRAESTLLGLERQRVVEHWLPVCEHMTVIGRVRCEGTTVIAPDPLAGLVLAPYPARRVLLTEALKGGAALAGIVILGVGLRLIALALLPHP